MLEYIAYVCFSAKITLAERYILVWIYKITFDIL